MNAVVFEHLKVGELPEAWQVKLAASANACVTVRIEEEVTQNLIPAAESTGSDPAFGIWRDRQDMSDVNEYVRTMRSSRSYPDSTGA